MDAGTKQLLARLGASLPTQAVMPAMVPVLVLGNLQWVQRYHPKIRLPRGCTAHAEEQPRQEHLTISADSAASVPCTRHNNVWRNVCTHVSWCPCDEMLHTGHTTHLSPGCPFEPPTGMVVPGVMLLRSAVVLIMRPWLARAAAADAKNMLQAL